MNPVEKAKMLKEHFFGTSPAASSCTEDIWIMPSPIRLPGVEGSIVLIDMEGMDSIKED